MEVLETGKHQIRLKGTEKRKEKDGQAKKKNSMIYRIIVLLIILQSCKTSTTPPPSVSSGNTAAEDTLEYKSLLHERQIEWSNMYEIDTNNNVVSNDEDGYVYGFTLARYLFVDSLMDMEKYRREYNSEHYTSNLMSYYYDDKIYKKVQKSHQVELLSIQDSPNQLYQDTISQIMKVVIDGDTFEYQAYLVKQPFIDIPLEEQKWETPRWDFKIPFSIDLFWDLYKDEPLVCEYLTVNFRTLSNSIYKRQEYYIDWLSRMIQYQDSDFARRKLCLFVGEGFSRMRTPHYAWLDSTMIQSIETTPLEGWFEEEKYRMECLETLWEGYEAYQQQKE